MQHVDLGHLDRLLEADEARDEIERQILPARAAAGHDDALCLAGQHQRAVGLHLHAGIVVGEVAT